MIKPIHVVLPVTVDALDPSVPIVLRIDIQNFPQVPKHHVIPLCNDEGKLRPFEEIQAEYAQQAIKYVGSAQGAEKASGVSRQTLMKWKGK